MAEATFGKYRLIAELGHGGMADVFLAVMAGPAGSGFSKLTVIKRLRQNLADEPEFVEMLVDEARISARLNHPNVVQTNEVGSVGSTYFIAMEYLDGQPLHRLQHKALQAAQQHAQHAGSENETAAMPSLAPSVMLPADPLPRDCQYLVLVDTLAGLHHAHELADYDGTPLQIVHRDVTPHNVFVTYDGQVKVVDFGIAKAVGRASETRQGVVKGKVRYMGPEQAIGQAVDRRADIFSVGVMLWEAAAGRRLWKDMEDLAVVQALVTGNVPTSPRSVDPNVPEEVDRICRKALAHNRDDRYATADEFRADLEQYLADTGALVSARRRLAASVSTLFHDKRMEIKAIIEEQLHDMKRQTGAEMRPVSVGLENPSGTARLPGFTSSGAVALPAAGGGDDMPTSITDAARTEVYAGRGAPSGMSAGSDPPAALRSSKLRVPMIAVAVGTFVGVGALAAVKLSTPSAAEVLTPVPAKVETTSSSSSDVRVKVTAAPPSAQITVDGAPVPSPYEARVARDTREHVLRVEAAGFEPHVETVRFDSDVTMVVTLTSARRTSGPATARPHGGPVSTPVAAGGRAGTSGPSRSTATASAPSPPVSIVTPPPATPATTPPPAASHKPNVPKPDIDKGDPWGAGK